MQIETTNIILMLGVIFSKISCANTKDTKQKIKK